MDETATFYVYQNGIVLGEFTITAIQTGLGNGSFTENDWVCGGVFKEWQPLYGITSTKQKSEGSKGDTRVLPDLQVRPAAKVTNKDVLSRSMRLKPRIR